MGVLVELMTDGGAGGGIFLSHDVTTGRGWG